MLATGSKSLTGYRLSIRHSADGFSFSVVSCLDGSVVQTDRFPVPQAELVTDVLRQGLRKPYLMDYRFQSVELVVDTPSTIVPLEHFNKADMLAFYRLCFPSQPASVSDMQYQLLSSVEAVMIFPLDQDILQVVRECYPDVKVAHVDARQLEHFAEEQRERSAPEDQDGHDAYVSIDGADMFVAVFQRSRLLYAASQPAGNDDNRTFLLLGIWRALGLSPQRDACHLEGASSELKRTIGEYILQTE